MTTQIFPPLDAATEAALRASIERFGVLMPVVVNQHGQLLDGHHRSRIAGELGVEFPTEVRVTEDDWEDREIARTLNTDRRHLSVDQRRANVFALRAEGHSQRAIASALGVSQSAVKRDLKVPDSQLSHVTQLPERITRVSGGTYPATREPKAEPKPVGRPAGQGFRKDKNTPYELTSVRSEQIAKKQKERLAEGMGMANGISRVLVDLDLGVVAAVCTDEEFKAWEKMADGIVAAFRTVKTTLTEVRDARKAQQ